MDISNLIHNPSTTMPAPQIQINAQAPLEIAIKQQTTNDPAAAAAIAPLPSTPTGPPQIKITNGDSHSSEPSLFTSDLVSPTIAASLPETYTIRALRKSDYQRGFLDCLRVLTTVGDITESEWDTRYDWMSTQGKGGYYLLVVDDGDRIVGTGALIVERKFIHHLGLVGHIEDIAVAKDQQGKKLGLKIIQALDFIAAKVGCYKSILDCSEANEGFYVKCGFKRAGLEMAHYYETG
jgi:glucosamine-phosphate N-acetyltransferase